MTPSVQSEEKWSLVAGQTHNGSWHRLRASWPKRSRASMMQTPKVSLVNNLQRACLGYCRGCKGWRGIGQSGLQASFPRRKGLEDTLFIRIWEPLGDHGRRTVHNFAQWPTSKMFAYSCSFVFSRVRRSKRTNAFSKDTVVTQLNKKLGHLRAPVTLGQVGGKEGGKCCACSQDWGQCDWQTEQSRLSFPVWG